MQKYQKRHCKQYKSNIYKKATCWSKRFLVSLLFFFLFLLCDFNKKISENDLQLKLFFQHKNLKRRESERRNDSNPSNSLSPPKKSKMFLFFFPLKSIEKL